MSTQLDLMHKVPPYTTVRNYFDDEDLQRQSLPFLTA